MTTTPDMIRILGSHSATFGADEPLTSAVAAAIPKGDSALNPAAMAAASNFPLASKMTLGMTPQRIFVFKHGWGNKVGAMLGSVDLARVSDIEITWNKKLAILAIGLSDAPFVVMCATDASAAEHFRLAFLRLRGRI